MGLRALDRISGFPSHVYALEKRTSRRNHVMVAHIKYTWPIYNVQRLYCFTCNLTPFQISLATRQLLHAKRCSYTIVKVTFYWNIIFYLACFLYRNFLFHTFHYNITRVIKRMVYFYLPPFTFFEKKIIDKSTPNKYYFFILPILLAVVFLTVNSG